MKLNHESEQRYARHLSLEGLGEAGQQRLTQTRMLVVGLGGLGCPLAMYLASSGVGTLGLVDDDRVARSNLGRQVLYETADIGRLKVEAACDRLSEMNPEITLHLTPHRLDESNAAALIADYDTILDGSDNVTTRFLLNRHCHAQKKPLIVAAIHGWQGQMMHFFTGGDKDTAPSPCYACLFPAPPLEAEMPKCSESGVFAPLAGIMGSWQAALAMQTALGIAPASTLWQIDLRQNRFTQSTLLSEPNCAICGA